MNFFNADNLPNRWDLQNGSHPLFSRIFLTHLGKTNAIPQKYFLQKRENYNRALCACFYRGALPMRLGPIVVKPKAAFCSLPMPYHSEEGFSPVDSVKAITTLMDELWPGLQLIVGLKRRGENVRGWSWKRQLVTVSQSLNHKSFDDYTRAMRSRYRNKLIARRRKWEDVEISSHDGQNFDTKEYGLYIDLLKNVKYPTEVMSYDFFREMPVPHIFLKAQHQNIALAWALLIPFGKELYMLFCGINRKHRNQYDSYHNILCEVVKYGIEKGYNKIHYGQTAEVAKIEIGGVPEERYMLMRHTNPQINRLIAKTHIFGNRMNNPVQRVFNVQKIDK